ncbi:MAG: arginine deiminase family protein [Acidobacteriota bacterium]
MVHVTSEIGRLRKVLVHEPGPEVDRMVPPMMEELLFDDILFGERAREEHGRFRRLLQLLGIEVVEARTLLEQTLQNPEARAWLWTMLKPEFPLDLRTVPEEIDPSEAVTAVVEGLVHSENHQGVEVEDLFRIAPLPNWCFQRDPQVIVGDGVIVSAMAGPDRWRGVSSSSCWLP